MNNGSICRMELTNLNEQSANDFDVVGKSMCILIVHPTRIRGLLSLNTVGKIDASLGPDNRTIEGILEVNKCKCMIFRRSRYRVSRCISEIPKPTSFPWKLLPSLFLLLILSLIRIIRVVRSHTYFIPHMFRQACITRDIIEKYNPTEECVGQ